MKKSFILYVDMLDVLDDLNSEDTAALFRAIKAYHNNETPILPYTIKAIYKLFVNQFDRDNNAYEKKCIKATAAANKRWHNDADGCERIKGNAQDADTVNVNDTVNDINLKTTPSSKMNGRVPFTKIIDLYHKMLPTLPRTEKLTTTREGYIRQRYIEDLPEMKNWENFFDYVSQSDFLMGKAQATNGRKVFRASLEWLTKPANFAKVLEEHYHGV